MPMRLDLVKAFVLPKFEYELHVRELEPELEVKAEDLVIRKFGGWPIRLDPTW